jgi:ElaB/YqjD/DUF883 family membrane-anchored ribosome-binding protein
LTIPILPRSYPGQFAILLRTEIYFFGRAHVSRLRNHLSYKSFRESRAVNVSIIGKNRLMSNPEFKSEEDALESFDYAEGGGIEERIKRLREETGDLADRIPDLPAQAREALRDIEHRLGELYDTVASQAATSVETIEEIVEARPLVSVVVAFGVGCLMGVLFGGPRRARSGW